MFDRATVRNSLAPGRFDAGLLAETLFFYGDTHLVLNRTTLSTIVRAVGVEVFLRLLNGHVQATFMSNMPLVTSTGNAHGFIEGELGSHKDGRRISYADRIEEALKLGGTPEASLRKMARAITAKMPASRLSADIPGGGSFAELFSRQLRLHPDLFSQAQIILSAKIPAGLVAPRMTRFTVQETSRGFAVETDLDWAAAQNQAKHLNDPVALNPAGILVASYDAFVEQGVSARYGGELVTWPMAEALVIDQVQLAMQRRARNSEQIGQFSRMELGSAYAIRETINRGEKTFAEFLDLLERSTKFKKMLRGAHPDIGLLKAYQDEVAKGNWIERTVPKTIRFSVFTGLALAAEIAYPSGIGTVAGVALGAADQFLLDKIRFGWRPNTFVQKTLKPFVGDE